MKFPSKPWLHPVALSLGSGILLWAAWPTSPLTFLLFVAFVPLLELENRCRSMGRYWALTYLTLLVWNGATTWWVGNTTVPLSGVLANVLNALLMTIPWIGYRRVRRRWGQPGGYLALVAYWMAFEFVHLRWELSWPWLDLGNAFAGHPSWVQWYEWTGAEGGTAWALIVNIHCFETLRRRGRNWAPAAIVLAAPLVLSAFIGQYRQDLDLVPVTAKDVVVVQPNVDPYNEKFEAGSVEAQIASLIRLSEAGIDDRTAYVIWPETAIPFPVQEDSIWSYPPLMTVRAFLERHPGIDLVTGLDGYRYFPPGARSVAMRRDDMTGRNYEEYNTAVQLDGAGDTAFYHKGKLVPGAEIVPYAWVFGFLEKFSLKFGGTSGTLGRGPVRTVFSNPHDDYRVGPIICYESIYGEYVTDYVRGGAGFLAIITNDGWWGDTQGYRQHAQYARLRAIETRRWIARSANTGISCFIDPLGHVYQAQPWNTMGFIRMAIPTESVMTLYTLFGDWISWVALGISAFFIIAGVVRRFRTNRHAEDAPI